MFAFVAVTQVAAQQSQSKQRNLQNNSPMAQGELKQAKLDSTAQYQAYSVQSFKKINANAQSVLLLKKQSTLNGKVSSKETNREIAYMEDRNASLKRKLQKYKADGSIDWAIFEHEHNAQMKALHVLITKAQQEN
jgi:hypothetical protein